MSADDDEASIYDQIEIEDMHFDTVTQLYTYPCPCGDRFEICIDDLRDGQDIAVCPSCSLMIRVIFELVSCCSRGSPRHTLTPIRNTGRSACCNSSGVMAPATKV